jgi:hypothetical protein
MFSVWIVNLFPVHIQTSAIALLTVSTDIGLWTNLAKVCTVTICFQAKQLGIQFIYLTLVSMSIKI